MLVQHSNRASFTPNLFPLYHHYQREMRKMMLIFQLICFVCFCRSVFQGTRKVYAQPTDFHFPALVYLARIRQQNSRHDCAPVSYTLLLLLLLPLRTKRKSQQKNENSDHVTRRKLDTAIKCVSFIKPSRHTFPRHSTPCPIPACCCCGNRSKDEEIVPGLLPCAAKLMLAHFTYC